MQHVNPESPARTADREVLADDDPRHPAVQFFADDAHLAELIAIFARAGFDAGEPVIVIATAPHLAQLRARLAQGDAGAAAACADRRLTLLDADETLAAFLIDGAPDPARFAAVIGGVLAAVGGAAGRRVRIYGEMIDVLWRDGHRPAAIALEGLWNEVARAHDLRVLCAYQLDRLDVADQRPEVSRLLQRTLALETELARRARDEAELRRRHDDLQDFFDNAPIALHWVGADGRIVAANQAELDGLGYRADQYIGHHLAEFHADPRVVEDMLARLAAHQTLTDFPARLRRKDGSIRHVLIDSNVRWHAGELVHTRCFTRDVTALRRAHDTNERLQRVTTHLSRALTPTEVVDVILSDGIEATAAFAGSVYLISADGRELVLNRAVGYPDDATEGFARIPIDAPLPLAEVARTGRPVYTRDEELAAFAPRWQARAVTGTRALAAVPLLVDGRPIGALGLSFTARGPFDDDERTFLAALGSQCAQALDRARLLDAEKGARAVAEAAERRKDELLAVVGHELRNPLAPILTALQLMQLRGIGGEREVEVIERQVRHMTRLVDDLLDVSRITCGKVTLAREPVEVAAVVAKAVEMASPLFEQRAHTLTIDVPRRGLLVDGDHIRLAQVLGNVLTNAAKYTDPRGRISVRGGRDGDRAVIVVKDDGIGIAPEMIERVFEPFMQGARRLERSQGGLGLGLALARNLVELHGGTIAAHSPGLGRGSEFVIRLPALAAGTGRDTRPSPAIEPRGEALRILVVDDNEDAAEMTAELLSGLGHDVRVAHDGPAALATAAAFAPDTALVDIGLPVMDGYELATRLRQIAGSRMRLIAVTGYGQEDDKTRSREVGFAVHLVKPVTLNVLVASLTE